MGRRIVMMDADEALADLVSSLGARAIIEALIDDHGVRFMQGLGGGWKLTVESPPVDDRDEDW